MDACFAASLANGFSQKTCLFGIAFKKMNVNRRGDCQNQSRKACAGAKISNRVSSRRQDAQELEAIGNMPIPTIVDCSGSNKIDPRLPFLEQPNQGAKPVE